MINRRAQWLICGWLLCAPAGAQVVEQSAPAPNDERQLSLEPTPSTWARDPARLEAQAGDKLETRAVTVDAYETVKLKNVIPPIRFGSGAAQIPEQYVELLRKALDQVRDRRNVRLHLVGYADNQRLSKALVRVYGDNEGLSRERAGQVAEYLKRALMLPADAISYEWAGDAHPIASNATAEGRALNRRVEVEVWYDQPKAQVEQREFLVKSPIKQFKVCRIETLCKLRFKEGQAHRSSLKSLVPALDYRDEAADVPPEFIEQIRKALANLRDKQNLVVKFIGYTDDAPLTGRNERIYGDAISLSKARARRVALAVQEALKLPSAEIASDGRGASNPVGPNDTEQGRAANRRIEVQFWYDDPLRDLPDEPQLCPKPDDSDVVTKVYSPPWGTLAPLQIVNGQPVIPAGYTELLRRAMADVHGKKNVRLRFVGYTANERLDRRTAIVYGDDIGLSAARARRAMETIRRQMHLSPSQTEHEGRGYVQSDDVVNKGFTQGQTSFIAVQVVYDEPAILDDYEGVDITRMTRELAPKNPLALNLMHITVNGEPIDDPNRSSADIQRCTDVALDRADIQFKFDDLETRPRLGIAVSPATVAIQMSEMGELFAQPVRFEMYSNYGAFIARAEVRIFDAGSSARSMPFAVVPVDSAGLAEWQPPAEPVSAAGRELHYVLRAYGKNGKFDETRPQSLWIIRDSSGAAVRSEPRSEVPDRAAGPIVVSTPIGTTTTFGPSEPQPAKKSEDAHVDGRLTADYGESELAVHNVQLAGGTITVHGSGIPANHTVWVAGREVPVDHKGNFIAQEILPTGTHTVEVAVLDEEGRGTLYLRDLQFKPNDRFYVAMADLTVSKTHSTGPAQLLQGANAPFDYDSTLYGSLAFFATQKFADDWRLTASADTREAPVKDLFSNFLDKSPESLFRRIDPDYYYPTFGDDSIVEEMAPTLGKFYVKLERGDDYALWGDFKVEYAENELAQVDRGLYGANGHWDSSAVTRFGEKRLSIDAFAADPGTIASREEFRGTGGSLYFLHNQDVLTGSERVRIELRDKDSGLVMAVKELQPVVDYEIDYLQGRVLLAEPLAATVDDNLLVRSSGSSGQIAYLVVRYEYTPGFQNISAYDTGGEVHYWLNDHVKIGLTASDSNEGGGSNLRGADVTLRKSADSWVRLQTARSEGLVSETLSSYDGGFGFTSTNGLAFANGSADGYRADLSLGVGDFLAGGHGRLTLYGQELGPGYSSPGFEALTRQQYYGGTFDLPLGKRVRISAKTDRKAQELGLETEAEEMDIRYELTEKWSVSTGARRDVRTDSSPVVPFTQVQGERTDAVAQVGYDSLTSWRLYSFVQDTVSRTDDREANGRAGVGGSYRVSNKLRVDAEASDGDLGVGGKLGTNYLYSDHTTLYINYSLEDERADNGLLERQGNLISGIKRRLSDSSSVYVEERYQQTDLMSGLTHATGVNLKVNNAWNVGADAEVGTLEDPHTPANTKRRAGGVRVGYAVESIQISSGVEYRFDDMEQFDATTTRMTTWLFRNNFKYQITPNWRVIGKFDHSISNSPQGQFYRGGFTEGVIGYGYRPVQSDRLDVLAKYTYFYNVPTAGQVTPQNVAAQFVQKSHIGSVDVTYDLTEHWTIGGKYAYRMGELSLSRENPQFFDNPAQLYILRADWHFGQQWEGMVEGRMLEMPNLNERRDGALIAVYRHLGKHVKAGLGYNFTSFSEDLTDMSFRSHGVFMNVVGAL